jgi:hypothetical protein
MEDPKAGGPNGDWNEWRRLVLDSLDRHERDLESMVRNLAKIERQQEGLVIKMAVITGICGLVIPVVVTALVTLAMGAR